MPGQQDGAGNPCPNCGSCLPTNARFCNTCGNTVTPRTVRPPQQDVRGPRPPDPPPVVSAPQQVTPAYRGVRCGAFLLDVAAMMSPALPLAITGAVLGVAEVIYIVVPVAFFAVWVWMQVWQGLTGKTFGKAMLGLRLVRAHGSEPPGLAATFLRSGLFVVTLGLVALPVLSSSEPQRGAHDRISGLDVVDVAVGGNTQIALRRPIDHRMNRVHSPVPLPMPRRG